MASCIIGLVVIFLIGAFFFASFDGDMMAGGIIALVIFFAVGIVAAILSGKKMERIKRENEKEISKEVDVSTARKVEFWDLTIYSSENKYAFNYCGDFPKTYVKQKGKWRYEVKIKTGFSQSVDLDNAFSLAAVSAIFGVGVILNGTDDNCIEKITLSMTDGVTNDAIVVFSGMLRLEKENIEKVKQFIAFANRLNSCNF